MNETKTCGYKSGYKMSKPGEKCVATSPSIPFLKGVRVELEKKFSSKCIKIDIENWYYLGSDMIQNIEHVKFCATQLPLKLQNVEIPTDKQQYDTRLQIRNEVRQCDFILYFPTWSPGSQSLAKGQRDNILSTEILLTLQTLETLSVYHSFHALGGSNGALDKTLIALDGSFEWDRGKRIGSLDNSQKYKDVERKEDSTKQINSRDSSLNLFKSLNLRRVRSLQQRVRSSSDTDDYLVCNITSSDQSRDGIEYLTNRFEPLDPKFTGISDGAPNCTTGLNEGVFERFASTTFGVETTLPGRNIKFRKYVCFDTVWAEDFPIKARVSRKEESTWYVVVDEDEDVSKIKVESYERCFQKGISFGKDARYIITKLQEFFSIKFDFSPTGLPKSENILYKRRENDQAEFDNGFHSPEIQFIMRPRIYTQRIGTKTPVEIYRRYGESRYDEDPEEKSNMYKRPTIPRLRVSNTRPAQAASGCAPSVEVLLICDVAANKAECGNTARRGGCWASLSGGSYNSKRLGFRQTLRRRLTDLCQLRIGVFSSDDFDGINPVGSPLPFQSLCSRIKHVEL
ncbi:hypothetical protein WN51_14120 [Melipona quadrifasciata]|uniref:Uncharacterized protein n=1 Tax=Melipona quadrifasciata TaxID=166423 RepID=A0A0M8ZZ33_9HYME|nr:hypothetical protein WN51_14120 [Melipona quadrifasciata]